MSQEMGKNVNQQEAQLTLKNHNPGCMWGILHHFQHNRWHNVVKRLPRKRLTASGKHSSDEGRIKSTSDGAKVQENTSSIENHGAETKPIFRSPTRKSSMKSRLKALITDEMYRKKDRHRRSTSYPTRKPLDKTTPVHNQKTIESRTDNESNDHSVHSPASPNDPKLDCENDSNNITSCEECHTMLKVNYLKQNEVSKLGKEPVKDHTVLHGNSIYAVEQSGCDSVHESKLFMDALDLLNVRQEVFLKILQDPSSSLANQLHSRRTPYLTKSVSFPSPDKRDFKSKSSTKNQENQCCIREEGEMEQYKEENKMIRKKNENKVGLRSFKNITAKIKHVIRDKKKEKNRIIKDAVHDKIPCDRCTEGSFKRTSSFNDSFDRSNQLHADRVNREEKDHVSDRLRFQTEDTEIPIRNSRPSLSRILSLPDLESNSSTHTDDSKSNGSLVRSATDVVNEYKPLGSGLESKVHISSVSDSEALEKLCSFDEKEKAPESGSGGELNVEHLLSMDPYSSNLDEVSENDCEYQEDDIEVCVSDEDTSDIQKDYPNFHSCNVPQEMVDIDTQESRIQQFCNDISPVQVDTKYEAEFNYVKDVLELSGFSRDEILGKWHSAEHPLDPSMYEEFEGCLVDQSSLLLFDLINEVLLGIYEISICYWPRSLTITSRIHQLPEGNRVLEEVWGEVRWLLGWRPEFDEGIGDAVSRDLARQDRWMNLQMDAECVGLELEDLIFDDLLHEIIFS